MNQFDQFHLVKLMEPIQTPHIFSVRSGLTPETANRFGAALGLRYVLTPSVTLGADYRFVWKDSNLPDAGYEQDMVLVSLYYNF